MQKKSKYRKVFPQDVSGISLINSRKFGSNFGTRNATKSIKPYKDSYYSLDKSGSFGRLPGDHDVIRM